MELFLPVLCFASLISVNTLHHSLLKGGRCPLTNFRMVKDKSLPVIKSGENFSVSCNVPSHYVEDAYLELRHSKSESLLKWNISRENYRHESNMTISTNLSVDDDGRYAIFCNSPDSSEILCSSPFIAASSPKNITLISCLIKHKYMVHCCFNFSSSGLTTTYDISFLNDFSREYCHPVHVDVDTSYCCNKTSFVSDAVRLQIEGTNSLDSQVFTYNFSKNSIIDMGAPILTLNSIEAYFVQMSARLSSLAASITCAITAEIAIHTNRTDAPSPQYTISPSSFSPLGERSSVLIDLHLWPFTYYEVSVRFVCDCQCLDSGESSEYFRTAPSEPLLPPAVFPGSYVSSDDKNTRSVSVFWKPIELFQQLGANFRYCLNVSTSGEQDVSVDDTSAVLTGLPTGSVSIDISSCNEIGHSDTVGIVVSARGGISQPSFVVVLRRDDGGIHLYWNAVHLATNYTVVWCTRKGGVSRLCERVIDTLTVVGDGKRLVNVSLARGVASSSQSPVGVASNSDVASSSLRWASCFAPENVRFQLKRLRVGVRNESSVTLEWEADCYTVYLTDSYHIDLRVNGLSVEREEYVMVFTHHDATHLSIYKLKPATIYNCTLAPVFGKRRGVSTSILAETTLNPPSSVIDLSVSNVTDTSAFLQWIRPDSDNVADYKISVSYGRDLATHETQHQLSRLLPFTSYTVSIRACNNAGCSRSRTNRFQTHVGRPHVIEHIGAKMLNASFAELTFTLPSVLGSDKPFFNITYVPVRDGIDLPFENQVISLASLRSTGQRSVSAVVHVPLCANQSADRYRFRVAAATNGSEMLMAPWSVWHVVSCTPELDYVTLAAVVIVSLVVALLAALLVLLVCRRIRRRWREVYKVRISLPAGLEQGEYPLVERRSSAMLRASVHDDTLSLAELRAVSSVSYPDSSPDDSCESEQPAVYFCSDTHRVCSTAFYQPVIGSASLLGSLTDVDQGVITTSDQALSIDTHTSPYIIADSVTNFIGGEVGCSDIIDPHSDSTHYGDPVQPGHHASRCSTAVADLPQVVSFPVSGMVGPYIPPHSVATSGAEKFSTSED